MFVEPPHPEATTTATTANDDELERTSQINIEMDTGPILTFSTVPEVVPSHPQIVGRGLCLTESI